MGVWYEFVKPIFHGKTGPNANKIDTHKKRNVFWPVSGELGPRVKSGRGELGPLAKSGRAKSGRQSPQIGFKMIIHQVALQWSPNKMAKQKDLDWQDKDLDGEG